MGRDTKTGSWRQRLRPCLAGRRGIGVRKRRGWGPGPRDERRSASAAGFTLLELMVVMSLIVILASLALVQYRHSVTLAREAVLKEDLYRMNDAIDQYYADKNKYPEALEDLVGAGYLRQIPVDPFTRSASTWQTVPAEPDPTNPASSFGIYAVKSGSEAMSSDGSRYADW